jgi:FkbM family methyltransferase
MNNVNRLILNFKKAVIKITAGILKYFLKILLKNKIGRLIYYYSLRSNYFLIAECGDISFIMNSSDKCIGRDIFVLEKAYDSEKVDRVFKYINNNTTLSIDSLIDIGANIGPISIYAISNKYVTRCISFEPEPNNFKLLKLNVALNGLNDSITTYNYALSNSIGYVDFELDETNYGDHRVRVSIEPGKSGEQNRKLIKVQTVALDDFVSEVINKNPLIWMDTQGFEGFVLCGAMTLIEKGTPIVTEFWPYGLKRADSFDKFVEALQHGNYNYLIILNDEMKIQKFNKEKLYLLADEIGWDGDYYDLLIY